MEPMDGASYEHVESIDAHWMPWVCGLYLQPLYVLYTVWDNQKLAGKIRFVDGRLASHYMPSCTWFD